MTVLRGSRIRTSITVLAWTALVYALSYMPVPHTPAICAQLEWMLNGLPDDTQIDAGKNAMLAIVWLIGVVAYVMWKVRALTAKSKIAFGSQPSEALVTKE